MCIRDSQISIQSQVQNTPSQSDDPFADVSHNKPQQTTSSTDDPFAGLEDIVPESNTSHKSDDHIDRLEDIGIGPSAWESGPVDDPFTSSFDETPESPANNPSVDASKQNIAQQENDDDWAGWVGSIPSNLSLIHI